MKVLEINPENFNEVVLKSDKPVLVDFYAEWCAPCKMLLPTLDKLANEIDNVLIVKVNVDNNGEIAKNYGIRGIPTLLLIDNGEVKSRLSGNHSLESLKEFLN